MDHAPNTVFEPVAVWPAELRPRERLLAAGPAALSDAELLAILLRTGRRGQTVVDVARGVLGAAGSLRAAAQLHLNEWQAIAGIGPAKAATVMAALELGRRTWAPAPSRPRLETADAVYRHVAPRFLGLQRECVWVLGLDAKNALCVEALVSAGSTRNAPVAPREVFEPLLRAGASVGVLAHNHPSGDPEPSPADLHLTRELVRAGRLLKISLVDHLVVGDGRFVSLRDRGIVDTD